MQLKCFQTNCVDCPGPDAGKAINEMVEGSTLITPHSAIEYIFA